MKKFLLFLSLLAFTPRLATAQEAKTAVGAERVTYSRAVPKALRAFVPRGGKSRFWGATKLQFEGKQIWVHVYDVEKIRYSETEDNSNKTQKSGLDLFIFSPSNKLKMISSNRFGYQRFGDSERGGDFEPVGIQTFYLNPQAKQTPIVQIEIHNPQSYYGTNTMFVFVTFDPKFKKATIQNKARNREWGNGNSNSGGWNTTFGIDEKGLVNIFYNTSSSAGNSRTTYKWTDNNYLKPSERKFRELEEGAEYEPIPLTPN